MKETVNYLLKLPVFNEFYTEEIQAISDYIFRKKFLAGQVLMRKGEIGSYLAIILDGEVNIVEDSAIFVTRTRGELLGEIALIESQPRSASVVAASDGEVAIISFDDIETIKNTHPQIAIKLISVLTKSSWCKLQESQISNTNKYLVLIANQNEYSAVIDFVMKHQDFWQNNQIATTPKLAEVLFTETNIKINKYLDYRRLIGTETAVGSLIMSGNVSAVIYLRTPILAVKNQVNLEAFLMLCDVYQIPLATNISTAEAILFYLENSLS
ncbi:MAG: cyclic nucleotide-binding domain-containing protein [Trichodesmium sp.]